MGKQSCQTNSFSITSRKIWKIVKENDWKNSQRCCGLIKQLNVAMVYGTKAIIPTKVGLPTLRTTITSRPYLNQRKLLPNLDLVEVT